MCIDPTDDDNPEDKVGGVVRVAGVAAAVGVLVGVVVGVLAGIAGTVLCVLYLKKQEKSSRQSKEHMCTVCSYVDIVWLTHFKQSLYKHI